MRYVEDKLKRSMRFGIYMLLASVSGAIGFLGYSSGYLLDQNVDVGFFESAHADAPYDGGGDDGSGGAGGNGSGY